MWALASKPSCHGRKRFWLIIQAPESTLDSRPEAPGVSFWQVYLTSHWNIETLLYTYRLYRWLRGKNLPAVQETQVRSVGREDPLEREWLPAPVFLPGESHGQTVRGIAKSRTRLNEGHSLHTGGCFWHVGWFQAVGWPGPWVPLAVSCKVIPEFSDKAANSPSHPRFLHII